MTPHMRFWESLYNVRWTPTGLFHYNITPFHRRKRNVVWHVNDTITGILLYWFWIILSDQKWLRKCVYKIAMSWTQQEKFVISWKVSPFLLRQWLRECVHSISMRQYCTLCGSHFATWDKQSRSILLYHRITPRMNLWDILYNVRSDFFRYIIKWLPIKSIWKASYNMK